MPTIIYKLTYIKRFKKRRH